MLVSPEDEIRGADPAVARAVFELIPEPKRWLDIPGGHFGLLWHPSEAFEQARDAQVDFFKDVL